MKKPPVEERLRALASGGGGSFSFSRAALREIVEDVEALAKERDEARARADAPRRVEVTTRLDLDVDLLVCAVCGAIALADWSGETPQQDVRAVLIAAERAIRKWAGAGA